MTKIIDLEARREAKLKEKDAAVASLKRISRRHKALCAAIFAALDAGNSLKEVARTLRLLADELDK
jgi:hypothetical protein